MKVVAIPLDQIDVGERLREIDEDYATMLAESFKADGQRTPIEVRERSEDGKYRLIAGAHRIRAAQIAGLMTVLAIVKTVTNDEAALLEIDENLIRHDLTALDRATFLAKRKELYLKIYPETATGGDRRSDQKHRFVFLKEKFSEATAKRLGVSDGTIDRAIRRFNRITPKVRRMLSGTWMANKGVELDALAKIEDPRAQFSAAAMVLKGTAKNVAAAWLVVSNKQPASVDQNKADYQAFRRRWGKYSPQTKQRIVELIMAEFELEYVTSDDKGR